MARGFSCRGPAAGSPSVAAARGDDSFAELTGAEIPAAARTLEAHGWDGEWYRRAYFDDGTPLGSKENTECRIDSIAMVGGAIGGGGFGSGAAGHGSGRSI